MTMAVRWLSGITAALVLIQAALIGQTIGFGDAGTQVIHGWLGSGSFIAAIILSVLAFLEVRRGELRGHVLALALLTTVLMVAQLGLGYIGRRQGWAASIHIPNGVLITGLLFTLLTSTITTPAPAPAPAPVAANQTPSRA